MLEIIFRNSVLTGSVCLSLMLGFYGCASTPEPKTTEEKPETVSEEKTGTEEIAPLGEEDRDKPGTAGEEDTGGEEVAALDGKDTAEEKAPADLPELGAETSELLSAAVDLAESDAAIALQKMQQAAEQNPKCYQCFYNQGVLHERGRKHQKAANAYKKALAIHPTHLQSVVNLSNLYLRLNKPSEAYRVVSFAVRTAPRDLGLRNQLVKVLLASRRVKQAVEQAKGILLVDERNVPAMISLGQAYHAWGKHELAERILLKAKEIDETSAEIQNRLGFVYLSMDNASLAIAAFKKALELDDALPEAHNNLGVLYSKAHDYTSATEHFRKAIALSPNFYEAYLNLGNALRGDKHFDQAEDAYRKAKELQLDEKAATFNLGLLYLDDEVPGYEKSERLQNAVKQLEEFEKKGGKHPKLADYLKEARKKHERAVKAELRRKKREEEKRRREEEKKRKEAEARAKAEAEAKAKAKAKAEAEAEAKAEAEAEAKARAEEEARKKAEAEAKARAEEEARKKAEAEAKARAEEEAREKTERDKAGVGDKLGGGKGDSAEPGSKLGGGKEIDDEEGKVTPEGSKVGGGEK